MKVAGDHAYSGIFLSLHAYPRKSSQYLCVYVITLSRYERHFNSPASINLFIFWKQDWVKTRFQTEVQTLFQHIMENRLVRYACSQTRIIPCNICYIRHTWYFPKYGASLYTLSFEHGSLLHTIPPCKFPTKIHHVVSCDSLS